MMNFSMIGVMSSFFMVFCGLWSFISYHKHLLNSLLSLEFMMLGVFWLLSMQMVSVGSEIYLSLFFLTLAACEGALSLSLLMFVVWTMEMINLYGLICWNVKINFSFNIIDEI